MDNTTLTLSLDQLEQLDTANRAARQDKSLYFRIGDAKELIAECERKDLAVVGIEALTLKDNGGIVQHLDLIADYLAAENAWSGYSWGAFRRECNKSAVGFLKVAQASGYPNLIFDFLVMEQGEYGAYLERHEARRRMLGLVDKKQTVAD